MRFAKKVLALVVVGCVFPATAEQRIEFGIAHKCHSPNTRQGALVVNTGNTTRATVQTWSYVPPTGYKICWATTNENSARPKGPQGGGPSTYHFSQQSPYFAAFTVSLPCPSGGLSAEDLGAGLGAAICAAGSACDPRTGAAVGKEIGKASKQCPIANGNSWFDGNAVFLLSPSGALCTEDPRCQKTAMPWQKFPSE